MSRLAVLVSLLLLVPAAAARAEVDVLPLTLTVDGQAATGLVFEPRGLADPEQLVVFAHGHGETASSFVDILTGLVERTGVPAVAMDFRGPAGHWNVGTGADDTNAATRYMLERHPSIAGTVLWGWSMGGMVSGTAAARAPELYDTWVSSFGAYNAGGAWTLFAALGLDDREEFEAEVGCSFPACPDRYVERSPSLLADRMGMDQVVLLHGAFDAVSPYQQTREMAAALTAAEIPVSVYTFGLRPASTSPAPHGRGVVAVASVAAVERVLAGTEPAAAPVREVAVPGGPVLGG